MSAHHTHERAVYFDKRRLKPSLVCTLCDQSIETELRDNHAHYHAHDELTGPLPMHRDACHCCVYFTTDTDKPMHHQCWMKRYKPCRDHEHHDINKQHTWICFIKTVTMTKSANKRVN